MKSDERSATTPSRTAPLHGGPVSPWPRRVRRLAHACTVFGFTCVLAVVVSVIGLTGATVLGAMPVILALLISAVVAYILTGLRPFAVALACATLLTILAAISETMTLEIERALDVLARAVRMITG